MNIDFEKVSAGVEYDLCVIGAGSSGIIVALEFSKLCPGKRILLADYGYYGAPPRNRLDDTIRLPNNENHHLPYECTNKGLGGSTATWGGRCVMFDRGDFVPRPLVGKNCTWTTSFYDECLPFVGDTQLYFESGHGAFALDRLTNYRPIADGFSSEKVDDGALERWSLPTRFGPHYRRELEASSCIQVLLGVELHATNAPDTEGTISSLVFRDVRSREVKAISCRVIVLSMGTQEVTRFLLRNKQVFARLPGIPEALGKYYQGHVSGKIASVQFYGDPSRTDFAFRRESDGSYQRRRFQFRENTLVSENLLNTAFWLDNPLYFDPAHKSGAMSFMYLAMLMPLLGKRLAPPAVAHSITKGKVYRVGAHLVNIVKDFPRSLWTPASIFFRRYMRKRKLPGVFLYSGINRYALHFHAEQIPDRENRMELAEDGETLIIRYSVSDADAKAVIHAHDVLDNELRNCGCGELVYWYPRSDLVSAIRSNSKDGVHQSGTTRIADSSTEGVVDRNLRIWGTKNMYVCSSSVFPTSSQANPTFFAGVCAVRLARHLASRDGS